MAQKFLASLVDAPNAYRKPYALVKNIVWDPKYVLAVPVVYTV
jgi:hypothetical protein